jgi:uncharacterized protein involved in cysteine biosynthesis
MSRQAAARLRQRNKFGVWAGGVLLAGLSFVPVINFFAPLFGAAFMVHLYKLYSHQERPV